jgi:hypothetical protein
MEDQEATMLAHAQPFFRRLGPTFFFAMLIVVAVFS